MKETFMKSSFNAKDFIENKLKGKKEENTLDEALRGKATPDINTAELAKLIMAVWPKEAKELQDIIKKQNSGEIDANLQDRSFELLDFFKDSLDVSIKKFVVPTTISDAFKKI